MKIAIVAMVRDEASDILPWIGWYRALGADTLLIFDDGSIDGTAELIEDAARGHDIRLLRVTQTAEPYYERQCAAYREAIDLLGTEFDWIGFFDADEYLNLFEDTDLKSFLGRFDPEIGAVAVNWCNYGSAGHVLKPSQPAYLAFDYHYRRDEPINRHVKSFLRPGSWARAWANVHYFELASGRYVGPDGADVVWSETRGITADPPSWDIAKVMHFQLRSMEHYVERMRKRPDVPADARHFIEADHNDVQDARPRDRAPAITPFLRQSVRQTARRVIERLRSPLELRTAPPAPPYNITLFAIQRRDGGLLCAEDDHVAARATATAQPILAVRLSDDATTVALFRPDRPLLMPLEPRLGTFHLYETSTTEAGTTLRHSGTRQYLTALPVDMGGAVSVDRREPQGWERFVLSDVTEAPAGQAILRSEAFVLLQKALAMPVTLDSIRHLSGASMPITVALLPLLATRLHPEEATILTRALGGTARALL